MQINLLFRCNKITDAEHDQNRACRKAENTPHGVLLSYQEAAGASARGAAPGAVKPCCSTPTRHSSALRRNVFATARRRRGCRSSMRVHGKV